MGISVYIHFPYCKRKCAYCDFVSYDDLTLSHAEYIQAVTAELGYFAGHLAGPGPVNTIYIGGGTPSLLDPQLVEKLVVEIQGRFGIERDPEITIEVNPGTVDPARMMGYRKAGVNRVSIGIQSMDAESLKTLGRIHGVEDNRSAYRAARDAGFDAVGIDLIFGLPGQTTERWLSDLREAMLLRPDHVSAYILKAPQGWDTPDEDIVSEMYIETITLLEKVGLMQYEVSNFARQGKESRHNSVYWDGGSYLGLGAAAHSYIPDTERRGNPPWLPLRCANNDGRPRGAAPTTGMRWSNETNIEEYVRRVQVEGNAIAQCEQITEDMAMDEAIMLGLRRRNGLDVVEIGRRFGEKVWVKLEKAIGEIEQQGLGEYHEGNFRLNQKGMLLSDELAAILALKAGRKTDCI